MHYEDHFYFNYYETLLLLTMTVNNKETLKNNFKILIMAVLLQNSFMGMEKI